MSASPKSSSLRLQIDEARESRARFTPAGRLAFVSIDELVMYVANADRSDGKAARPFRIEHLRPRQARVGEKPAARTSPASSGYDV